MTAPLRFLLLVIGGWIALRAWAIGEPSLGRFIPAAPVRLAAAPATTARPAAALASSPTSPLATAAAAAAAAAQAAAAAVSVVDAAAAAAEAASIAAEVAAAVAGVPVVRRARLAVDDPRARRFVIADRAGRSRQPSVHHASADYFRQQARYWRELALRHSVPAPAAAGDWSLDRYRRLDAADRFDRGEPAPIELASSSLPPVPSAGRSSSPGPAPEPGAARDRLRLTGWLLWRPSLGTSSLASGATLGDSQAGARLAYDLRPGIAASLRAYAPLRRTRGGEVAAGLTLTPLRNLPLRVTAERRQRLGSSGGRSAFAMFAEGGFYQRPLPLDFTLDGYAQGGIVGVRSRDKFVDGALTFARPLIGPVRAGGGVWGGTQPGASRLDLGPRLSLRLNHRARVDLDWRMRVAGKARPSSGPALTIAGDF